MKLILVTCYVNPDLDGVAGVVGYAEFLRLTGQEVTAGILGQPHDEAKYILDRFGFIYPEQINDTTDFDNIILVDASDLNGFLGKVPPEKVMEIIDHRQVHEADKFPNAKAQIELVGAAATLVAEKFILNKVDISRRSAVLLCGAIISNTLNFKAGTATERDERAYEWLNRFAGLPDDFWQELFTAKSDFSGARLAERIKNDFAWFTAGGKKAGIAQLEMIGARRLIEQRSQEIIQTLKKIKLDLSLDFIFLTAIELKDEQNYFVADDKSTKKLLEKVLAVKFSGNIARRPGLIMRKQIIPLLKDETEKRLINL